MLPMDRQSLRIASRLETVRWNRRQLVRRLTAAGFAAPVIAGIMASAPERSALARALEVDQEFLDFGKDERLIPYGSTNLGMPLELMEEADNLLLTPQELFFVRSNGPVPEIEADEWRLTVSGLVDEELELSLDDLQSMSTRTVTAFLECSGDSRSRFPDEPAQTEGTQWGNDAIGNAEWTGVPLRDVLAMAGLQDGVVDIVSQGGDFPEMRRGLPLANAMDPNVILAWEINGEPLLAPHGYPVRLFVPAWGGIASTKWIVGLEAIDRVFDGPFNSESYVMIDEDETVVRPVREWPVKSIISVPANRPDEGVTMEAGSTTIAGYAWSGYGGIANVDLSVDGGESYEEAEIVLEAGPLSWVRFEYEWDAEPGDYQLRTRATDNLGLTQPEEADWNAKGYLNNGIYQIDVTVE